MINNRFASYDDFQNESILLSQKARPMRLCFLIPPRDAQALSRSVEICTSLWGGTFNFMIPMILKRPLGWSDQFDKNSARKIIEGYLDAFEPDCLINFCDSSVIQKLSLDAYRVIHRDDFADENPRSIGISAFNLYEQLFHTEFKFERKYKPKFVSYTSKESSLEPLASICFGRFPLKDQWPPLKTKYTDVFGPESIELDYSNLLELQTSKIYTPLNTTSVGLSISRNYTSARRAVYLLDPANVIDLIDFWNLRALGWQMVAIPCTNGYEIGNSANELLREFIEPPSSSIDSIRTVLLKGRSISQNLFKRCVSQFDSDLINGAQARMAIQEWYPRIWIEYARPFDGVERCELTFNTRARNVNAFIKGRTIRIEALSAGFDNSFRTAFDANWINVVKPMELGIDLSSTLNLPRRNSALKRLLGSGSISVTAVNSEGICLWTVNSDQKFNLKLPEGIDIIGELLKGLKLDLRMSDPGRSCWELLRVLGDLYSVRYLANAALIQILNELASKILTDKEQSGKEDTTNSGKKKWIHGTTLPVEHFKSLLKDACKYDELESEFMAKFLAERGVLRVGLNIVCPICQFKNWYTPSNLSDSLICERCLRSFAFPASNPPKGGWSYRTQGVFSLSNFASGAYTTALSLGFFSSQLSGAGFAIPSFEIKVDTKAIAECDFAIWWRDSSKPSFELFPILGECKTFGELKRADIIKMKKLMQLFPEAIFVFSTLRERLTPKESKMLKALALYGRKRWRVGQEGGHLLILTSEELLTSDPPPDCWQKRSKQFPNLSTHYENSQFGSKLITLCDVTQQLHLGMEPYHHWLKEYYDKKASRAKT